MAARAACGPRATQDDVFSESGAALCPVLILRENNLGVSRGLDVPVSLNEPLGVQRSLEGNAVLLMSSATPGNSRAVRGG
jgi:hypothetical protein